MTTTPPALPSTPLRLPHYYYYVSSTFSSGLSYTTDQDLRSWRYGSSEAESLLAVLTEEPAGAHFKPPASGSSEVTVVWSTRLEVLL